jgi:hypothetical protein
LRIAGSSSTMRIDSGIAPSSQATANTLDSAFRTPPY